MMLEHIRAHFLNMCRDARFWEAEAKRLSMRADQPEFREALRFLQIARLAKAEAHEELQIAKGAVRHSRPVRL